MKLPAIRAQIGIWVYYITALSFKQVRDNVKKIDDELHKSKLLREMLQRSITDNYKSIARYIESQDERFVNSLILAVYDGDPQWKEVVLEYNDGEEFFDLGILEFAGDEKIFPVDGQHRVEGIKKALNVNQELENEKIPVIFIGHKKDEQGMQRARRLFSTLNRYAKPVSMRDIITLDEDDIIAIASRELIDNHPLFSNERILDIKTKAIPETNNKAFTTIITFYECNKEILHLFLKNKEVFNGDGRMIKGKNKINEFIKKRPEDDIVNEFLGLCNRFWDAIMTTPNIQEYVDMAVPDSSKYRNREGGLLLFRPAGIIPFFRAVIKNVSDENSILTTINRIPIQLFYLKNPVWKRILWEPETKRMIMNNQTVTELLLRYFIDIDNMTESEIEKMKEKIMLLNQLTHTDDVDEIFEQAIRFTPEEDGYNE